ncbi:hypothetical protein VIGAN_02108900 [Vigna angularis var. angularis]|uniref:GRF-type domain-containing protein n=1 Tax=Vigna angularis var. angularis TaxID=157739 RepID=A0A0S3RDE0_PHAAN|nr:uncharacterized protein LOC128196095 [Vigna angularis]BAT78415.1 hypothetical protein VIGAN_02108900 [Vigna angularis var. angularis]
MSASQSSFSCCNSLGHRSYHCSHGGGSMGLGIIPICNCGEMTVVKMARTSKNAGIYFWGCRNYKSGASNVMCCNYFKWCNEENVDERDVIIGRQRRKIYDLENTVKALKKRIQLLVAVVGIVRT